jgi:hypothetical protein
MIVRLSTYLTWPVAGRDWASTYLIWRFHLGATTIDDRQPSILGDKTWWAIKDEVLRAIA